MSLQSSAPEASGHVRNAVSSLTVLDRFGGDPEINERMASLSCRRPTDSPQRPGRFATKRQVVDPFPDVTDAIPVVASHDLSGELVRGAITHHGSLFVRGLIDRRFIDAVGVA